MEIHVICAIVVLSLGLPNYLAEFLDIDVCQNENFQPNCPGSESIFIETAKYGRIRSGKCFEIDEKLEDDPKWMGCAVDVTDILRQKCSVRHYCDVPVKDKELSVMSHPCHKGLLMSLNVRYRCMPVLLSSASCIIPLSSEPKSFLVPLRGAHVLTSDHCGSSKQPWTFETLLGQKIKLTSKLVLSENQEKTFEKCPPESDKKGYLIGHLTFDDNRKQEQLCLNSDWESNYESKHHLLNLVLSNAKNFNKNGSFLVIEVVATGCLDLIPAEDAWLKRIGDMATIGCYSSRQTWLLKCIGSQWIGVVGNCSMGKILYASPEDHIHFKSEDGNFQTLSLVMICGFGLALCMVIVCCGIYCSKRISNNYKKSVEGLHTYNHNSFQPMSGVRGPAYGNSNNLDMSAEHYSAGDVKNGHNSTDAPAYFVLDEDLIKDPKAI